MGGLKSLNGSDVLRVMPGGGQQISENPDFTSFHKVNDSIYAFVHFEGPLPSQLYFMELSQDVLGNLKVIRQKAIDFSKWGGLWLPCAGSVTPWHTHLGSEEYEPDAKVLDQAETLMDMNTTSPEEYNSTVDFMRYFGVYPDALTMEKVKEVYNPYHYGYITELQALDGFQYTNAKHYSMGRLSHEMGLVLPDSKTVYMADDGTNTALYKYIADKAGSLYSGTVYIAKVKQLTEGPSDAASTNFDMSWIKLGHATQEDIKTMIDGGITWSDIFEEPVKKVSDTESCPEGYTSINAGHQGAKRECLKLKSGMEQAAAFLETRRFGALLNGTTEFSKLEGITYSPERNTVIISASDVRYGMEDNMSMGVADGSYDAGGRNDVRLKYNPCGCVYEMQLDDSYDAKKLVPLVCGTIQGGNTDNLCSLDGIASPDNIDLLPYGNGLIIGEDTIGGHQNDMIWIYNFDSKSLTRVATSPYGSEFTGTSWYEINDWAYFTAVVQHPYGESDQQRILDPESTGNAGTVGYIGPIPLKDVKNAKFTFTEIAPAMTNAEKHIIRISPMLTVHKM